MSCKGKSSLSTASVLFSFALLNGFHSELVTMHTFLVIVMEGERREMWQLVPSWLLWNARVRPAEYISVGLIATILLRVQWSWQSPVLPSPH